MDPRRYPQPDRRDHRPPGSGYPPRRPSFEPSPYSPGPGGYNSGGYDSGGYGSDPGYGYGSQDGGYGDGYGHGSPGGYGSGNGYYGSGDGYGYGSGDGYGYGSRDGGYGSGDGYGRGYGSGDGYGPVGYDQAPPPSPPPQPSAPWESSPPTGRPPGGPGGRPPGGSPGQSPGRPPNRSADRPSGQRKRNPRIAAWVGGLSAVALVAAGGLFYARGTLNGHSLSGYRPPSASGPAAGGPAAGASGSTGTSGSSGSSASSGLPASLGSGWKKTFNATFPGDKLDPSVWDTCYPWESQSGCTNFGNSDEEFQWYMPSQDRVSDGAMNIVAQKAPTEGTTSGGSPEAYDYRSGLVTTYPGYSFQYGYIQVEARMPSARGLWTALWLAAKNESWPPEVDIVEHWDNDAKYFQYYHPADAPRENSSVKLDSADGWHKFGVDWTASKVTWYIDGRAVFSTGRNVPQTPMYFLANVAVDERVSSLGGNAALGVKSVSVWQHQ